MTNDNKPPMFGPSAVIDPATHEPRSGKSALMNELMAEFAGKPKALAKTIIGNCTTTIPLKFAFDGKDTGHTVVIGSTGNGMSALPDARRLEGQHHHAPGQDCRLPFRSGAHHRSLGSVLNTQ